MRIAVALFSDFPFGGLQRDARRIAEGLAGLGHDVTLVARDAEGAAPEGVTRRLLPAPAGSNHRRDHAFAQALQDIKAEFDLIVGCNKLPGLDIYFAADDCWKARHGWWHAFTPRGRHHLARERAIFAPGGKTQILALAPAQMLTYQKVYGTEPERFQLLPPLRDHLQKPLARDAATHQSARQRLGLPLGVPLALFVARDAWLKGLDRALKALASTSGLHLAAVIEDGARWRNEAQRLGLGSRFHALALSSDLASAYAAADFLLHPARLEAAGKVISEALASGLPVVTSAPAGYARLVRESGAGAVLPLPFEGALLAEVLQDLLRGRRLAHWQARAARYAEKLSTNGQDSAIAAIGKRSLDLEMATLVVPPDFEELWSLAGDLRRQQDGRSTSLASWRGADVAVKRHAGATWRERVKNLLQGKRAIGDALPEWRALQALETLKLGAPKALVMARRGRRSALVMGRIDTSRNLDDLARSAKNLRPAQRHDVIRRLGLYLGELHRAGLAHRDFYLTHLYLNADGSLTALDWHRALIHRHLSERWIVKDLAALYFSAKAAAALSMSDIFRFIAAYSGLPPRIAAKFWARRWRAVEEKARRIAAHDAKIRPRAAPDA